MARAKVHLAEHDWVATEAVLTSARDILMQKVQLDGMMVRQITRNYYF